MPQRQLLIQASLPVIFPSFMPYSGFKHPSSEVETRGRATLFGTDGEGFLTQFNAAAHCTCQPSSNQVTDRPSRLQWDPNQQNPALVARVHRPMQTRFDPSI